MNLAREAEAFVGNSTVVLKTKGLPTHARSGGSWAMMGVTVIWQVEAPLTFATNFTAPAVGAINAVDVVRLIIFGGVFVADALLTGKVRIPTNTVTMPRNLVTDRRFLICS